MSRTAIVFVVGAALSLPLAAQAHTILVSPTNRYDCCGPGSPAYENQKMYPCGNALNPPATGPTTDLTPGEMIQIELDEYVDHNGHFRIAIAPNDTDFVDPTAFDDFYNHPNVYLDNITDGVGDPSQHLIDFEVPDIDCQNCTMQVIQVMVDGTFNGNEFYYSCAQVSIDGVGPSTTGPSDSSSDDGSMTSNGPGSTSNGDDSTSNGSNDSNPSTTNNADSGMTTMQPTTGQATGDDGDDGGGCAGCRTGTGTTPLFLLSLVGLTAVRRRRR